MIRLTTSCPLVLFGALALSFGCDTSQEPRPERVSQSALTESGDVLLTWRQTPNSELMATIESAKEGTDALRVSLLQDPPDWPGLTHGMRILDAQWMGEDGLAVLGADGVLRHHTEREVRILDREVLGPLSVSSRKIAYVHGEPPDLFLRVHDLDTHEHVEIGHVAPAWSPALSQDGQEVLFTASYQGRAHLFVRRATGQLDTIPTGLRTPSSPTAPIWRDGDLFFEDERGVVHLDLETASIEAEYEGAKLLPYDQSPRVQILEDGKTRVIATWTPGEGR